jgi:O-antigen/teichoic acid export membrane protein
VLRPLLDDTGALFTAIGQPRRITLVLIVQAVTLAAVGTPLTVMYGAMGTALGVGAAFVVGIALTYRFVSQVVRVNLFSLFITPLVATLVSAIFGLWLGQLPHLASWHSALPRSGEGWLTASLFVIIMLAMQGRAAVQRVRYVWALLWKPTG